MALAHPSTSRADVPHHVDAGAVSALSRTLAFRHDALPLALAQGNLSVGVADERDTEVLDLLHRATRLRILPVAMPLTEIRERLRAAYGEPESALADRAGSPAVRFVDDTFARALALHASDIHIEPCADGGGTVRVRVDGILRDAGCIPRELLGAVISRTKLLAGMDIADKRQPQDGRCSITVEQRAIDVRVSSMPTIDGEKVVVRVLDRYAQAPALAALGMPPFLRARYAAMVQAPWGFIVASGPTGSGKTTTLYASIAELDFRSRNVCSVEDPIEMRLPGIAQVQVHPRAGLSFAGALRAFMRQDPNVILVGEMRDTETAGVAISAALAGQLVLTTLHSNDAPRTVERLVDLGVARHALAAGLTAVLAQRLVRRVCERCAAADAVPEHIRRRFGIAATQWPIAVGCKTCDGSGYVGRTGVFELLTVDDPLRDAIAAGAPPGRIAQLAADVGYAPMLEDGIAKVIAGETTYAEVTRVVADTNAR